VSVYSYLGVKIFESEVGISEKGSQAGVDLSAQPSGIYFARTDSELGSSLVRFIKP
jgi:hypothetical protein